MPLDQLIPAISLTLATPSFALVPAAGLAAAAAEAEHRKLPKVAK